MTLLGVDGETAAAYQQLHEAGGVYRDLANQFASGLQDLAALAQNMSGAASNYHEAAVAALETVTREQMPHAEAAQATGHGGADGHFYGVSSTQHVALPSPVAGALPAGN
jgi:2-polyprenyl-6-methoxyphenol hydroxylase-like FAD-dependent oxidoreductase